MRDDVEAGKGSASAAESGAATTLSGPGQRALLADLCDGVGTGLAARMLAWQDFVHRSTMVLAPPLAGWAVTVGGPFRLLWAEAAGVALGAALLLTVRGTAAPRAGERAAGAPALRHVLARHPEVRRALTMTGVAASPGSPSPSGWPSSAPRRAGPGCSSRPA
ncbi:hypothetical protein [Micromonospora fulviviridis]|uniref:Uncharacterized protein n=1 Tax=Micromonospora fulviviridis TaxID=47860 RepID=A0ABV2VSK0_9ACTN